MKVDELAPPGSGHGGPNNYGSWFTASLGGQQLPGKWEVASASITTKMDPKKKPGASGANPVLHGLDPQHIELEGTQYTDDERQALADMLAQLVPQPGQDQNQYALQLVHPALTTFGFSVKVVVLGCSAFQRVDVGITRVRLNLHHWLPAPANQPSATKQPKRAIHKTREHAAAAANPDPASQAGAAAPPPGLKPNT